MLQHLQHQHHDMLLRLRSLACSWRSCATWGSGTRAPSSWGTTTGPPAPATTGWSGSPSSSEYPHKYLVVFMFSRAVCYVNMSSYNLQSSQSSLNQIYCIDICAFSNSLSLDTVSTKLIRVSWSKSELIQWEVVSRKTWTAKLNSDQNNDNGHPYYEQEHTAIYSA